MNVMIFLGIGIVGILVCLLGLFVILSRNIIEPSKKLQQRVEHLENEIKALKDKKEG